MRRTTRLLSWTLIVPGVGVAATISVRRWQDPVAALYTAHRQSQLNSDLRSRAKAFVTLRPEKGPSAAPVCTPPSALSAPLLDGLRNLDDAAIVPTGFPNTLWESIDAFERLADQVLAGAEIALGLFETAEPHRCDIVEVGPGVVRGVVVKPADPAVTIPWRYLAALSPPIHAWDEPGGYFDHACRSVAVTSIQLSGRYVDIGMPESLARVTAEIGT